MMGVNEEVGDVIALQPSRVRTITSELETAAKQTPTIAGLVAEIVQGIGETGGEIVLLPAAVDDFLTTAEVAQMYRVTDRVVRKWCEAGYVKATRVGPRGEWRILRSQFAAGPAEVRKLLDTVTRINSRFQGEEIDDYE